MNKITTLLTKLFVTLIVILLSSCDGLGGPDEDIIDVIIEISELTATDSSLTAAGTVSNTGNATIEEPWNVEGKFYADNTHTTVIGFETHRKYIPLGPGETIGWELSIISNDLTIYGGKEVSDYPNFSVSSLRVYK